MRTAALIIAAAAAFTLSACNKPAEDTAADASTEAAEASGAAVDTAATGADGATSGSASSASAAGTSRSASGGQTMAPSGSATVNDGSMAPAAQPAAGEGTTITETQRRLNPPQNNQPAQ